MASQVDSEINPCLNPPYLLLVHYAQNRNECTGQGMQPSFKFFSKCLQPETDFDEYLEIHETAREPTPAIFPVGDIAVFRVFK